MQTPIAIYVAGHFLPWKTENNTIAEIMEALEIALDRADTAGQDPEILLGMDTNVRLEQSMPGLVGHARPSVYNPGRHDKTKKCQARHGEVMNMVMSYGLRANNTFTETLNERELYTRVGRNRLCMQSAQIDHVYSRQDRPHEAHADHDIDGAPQQELKRSDHVPVVMHVRLQEGVAITQKPHSDEMGKLKRIDFMDEAVEGKYAWLVGKSMVQSATLGDSLNNVQEAMRTLIGMDDTETQTREKILKRAAVATRKPERKRSPAASVTRTPTPAQIRERRTLGALAKGNGQHDVPPPVMLHVPEGPTSDRNKWNTALQTIGECKFIDSFESQLSFETRRIALRQQAAETTENSGINIGVPTFTDFGDQITSIASSSAPGRDEVYGKYWKHLPMKAKVKIYE